MIAFADLPDPTSPLAATGKGHGTDRAVLMGLEGEDPETIDPGSVDTRAAEIDETRRVALLGRTPIAFDPESDLLFRHRESLPYHSNGMRFSAYAASGVVLEHRVYYSVGLDTATAPMW